MSAAQLLIIALCGVFGYWFVSKFLKDSDPGTDGGAKTQSPDPHGQKSDGQFGGWDREQWQQQKHQQQTSGDMPGSDKPAEWHEILGVSPTASLDEIKRAYRGLISQYHPDRVDGMAPEVRELCENKSKELNAAYQKALTKR
jgi:hypothetical protein